MTVNRSQNTVLIVDDNPDHLDILTKKISAMRYSVEGVSDAAQAIDKIKKKLYAVILADILMPSLDDIGIVRLLRRNGFTGAIIALSSISSRDDVRRSLEAGADAFIAKPTNPHDLESLITGFITGKPIHFPVTSNITLAEKVRQRSLVFSALLVEQDDETAAQIISYIAPFCRNVEHVKSGIEAWKKTSTKDDNHDIILSNLSIADIDGLGLLARVKARKRHIPFILYAGKQDEDTFDLGIEMGADAVVTTERIAEDTIDLIDGAIYHARGMRDSFTSLNRQLAESRVLLYDRTMIDRIAWIDTGYSALGETGGDNVHVRQFNKAGLYGIILLDAAGHDIQSSYVNATVHGILSTIWDANRTPSELLIAINRELLKLYNYNYHLCATAMLWDRRRRKVYIASGGNPGGILIPSRRSGTHEYRELEGGGMCLGLLVREDLYNSQVISFEPGDVLYFHSDGISRRDLLRVIGDNPLRYRDIPPGYAQHLVNVVRGQYPQTDDMTLLVMSAPEPLPPEGRHYAFRTDMRSVNDACSWAESKLSQIILPPDTDRDFIIISLREALINSVEHGNRNDPDTYVDISLYPENDRLIIEVSDYGTGFDLERILAQAESHNGLQMGRRGVPLMAASVQELKTDGGTVTMVFG